MNPVPQAANDWTAALAVLRDRGWMIDIANDRLVSPDGWQVRFSALTKAEKSNEGAA